MCFLLWIWTSLLPRGLSEHQCTQWSSYHMVCPELWCGVYTTWFVLSARVHNDSLTVLPRGLSRAPVYTMILLSLRRPFWATAYTVNHSPSDPSWSLVYTNGPLTMWSILRAGVHNDPLTTWSVLRAGVHNDPLTTWSVLRVGVHNDPLAVLPHGPSWALVYTIILLPPGMSWAPVYIMILLPHGLSWASAWTDLCYCAPYFYLIAGYVCVHHDPIAMCSPSVVPSGLLHD